MVHAAKQAVPQAEEQRLRLFISYSRADHLQADAMVKALEAAGFKVSIDRRDLPYGEAWQSEVAGFIQDCDTVVWLASPDSVGSRWVQWELGEVVRLSKRLMPVCIRDLSRDQLPPALGRIHMLPAVGVFDAALHMADLVHALETDRAWLKQGTALAERARQWRGGDAGLAAGRARARPDDSALLSGAQLASAEAWRQRQPPRAPGPSQDVLQLILASRVRAERRRRVTVLGSLAVALAGLLLAGVAWWQRSLALERQDRALANESRMLSALARQRLQAGDVVGSMLVAYEALPDAAAGAARPYVAEAERALYAALVEQREERVWTEEGSFTVDVQPRASRQRVWAIADSNRLRRYDLDHPEPPLSVQGTEGLVTHAVWSPDGRRLLAFGQGMGPVWAYLWDLEAGREIAVLRPRGRSIETAAFSGDSRVLVLALGDDAAQFYDAGTGEALQRLDQLGVREPTSVALNQDGRILAAGGDFGALRLWRSDGRPLGRPAGHRSRVVDLRFLDGGGQLLSVSWDRKLRVWDLATAALRGELQGHQDIVLATAYAARTSFVLTGSQDDTARLWPLPPGSGPVVQLAGHAHDVLSVDLSPDAALLLTASGDGSVRLWQPDGRLQAVLSGHDRLQGVRLDGSGTLAVTWGGATFRSWQLAPQRDRLRLLGHREPVFGTVFSADGAYLASYALENTARLWPRNGGVLELEHSARVLAAGFQKGAQLMTVAGDGAVRRWDSASGKQLDVPLAGLGRNLAFALFSPDASRLLVTEEGGGAALWSLARRQKTADLMPQGKRRWDASVARAVFSEDGRRLATVAGLSRPATSAEMKVASGDEGRSSSQVSFLFNDDVATLWDTDKGVRLLELESQGQPIERLALNRYGTRLAVLLKDGRVRIYACDRSARLLRSFQADPGAGGDRRWLGFEFSPDGRRLLTSTRLKGEVWDAHNGTRLAVLAAEGEDIGRALFSPDGRTIAGLDGNLAHLWRADDGQQRARLEGHAQSIRSAAFDPRGGLLVTGSWDGSLRRWPYFDSLQGLLQRTRQAVPRCLGSDERARMLLSPQAPGWCASLASRPSAN